MVNRIKKTLESLMYGVPIALASLLTMKDASAQMIKIDYFPNTEVDSTTRVEKKNTIYLTTGQSACVGLRYDRKLSPKFGAYSSLSRDNYGTYTKNHIKAAVGCLFYLKDNFPIFDANAQAFVSVGSSYNIYHNSPCPYDPKIINEKMFNHLSFEAGWGVRLGRFTLTTSYDFKQYSLVGLVGFGISF